MFVFKTTCSFFDIAWGAEKCLHFPNVEKINKCWLCNWEFDWISLEPEHVLPLVEFRGPLKIRVFMFSVIEGLWFDCGDLWNCWLGCDDLLKCWYDCGDFRNWIECKGFRNYWCSWGSCWNYLKEMFLYWN